MRSLRFLPFLLLLALPGSSVTLRPPAPVLVVGQVRDAAGPVAGAVVRFQGESDAVWTDDAGRFQLRRPAGARRLTAWKDGYFIAGVPADAALVVLTLHRLPDEDSPEYAWVDPSPDPNQVQACANCHGEIYREWSLSGHARSASNRRFLNLYDGSDWTGRATVGWNLRRDHPDGAAVCASCHAPTVGINDDLTELRGAAARGVHCDYCHKISGLTDGPLGQTHGRYGLQLLRPKEGQLFFGSLDDVDRGEDAFAPLYRRSRYCASCHEGVVFGVHVYSTYSEWLDSPAGKQGRQCQNCHMTPTGRLSNIAPGKGGKVRDPHSLANHRFFAGSQEEMLRRCLKVSADLARGNDELRVSLAIRVEDVGHRVPTGFVDRHLLLVVEALDGAGAAVPLLRGTTLPPSAGKELAGRAGRLYAKQLTDFEGRGPVPFWIARPDLSDTRLRPETTDWPEFVFAAAGRSVRVRLLYRRFWQEVAQTKGWPDDTFTVVEQTFP